MNKRVINEHNLTDDEITEISKKAYVIVKNSRNEIVMCLENDKYIMFMYDTEEDNYLTNTIIRKVNEVITVDFESIKRNPINSLTIYKKDYPKKGVNRKIEIGYYVLITDYNPFMRSKVGKDVELKFFTYRDFMDEINNYPERFGENLEYVKGISSLLS